MIIKHGRHIFGEITRCAKVCGLCLDCAFRMLIGWADTDHVVSINMRSENPIAWLIYRLDFKVPLAWSSIWEGPEDPVHYLRALIAKTLALGSWVEKSESGSLLRDVLDLSELFHPDTFLNALRQQTARWVQKRSLQGSPLFHFRF